MAATVQFPEVYQWYAHSLSSSDVRHCDTVLTAQTPSQSTLDTGSRSNDDRADSSTADAKVTWRGCLKPAQQAGTWILESAEMPIGHLDGLEHVGRECCCERVDHGGKVWCEA